MKNKMYVGISALVLSLCSGCPPKNEQVYCTPQPYRWNAIDPCVQTILRVKEKEEERKNEQKKSDEDDEDENDDYSSPLFVPTSDGNIGPF